MLGSPIAHSLSPVLHRAAYAELGLPWRYDAVECIGPQLPGLLDGLGPEWAGLSLTMPLKIDVLPLLERLDPTAARLGAVNTVVLGDGQRTGHNTDVDGVVVALSELMPDAPTEAVLLGAGGTARAALTALGSAGCSRVHVVARTPERARQLADLTDAEVVVTAWSDAPQAIAAAALVVSTVPAGAARLLAAELGRRGGWPPAVALLDVLYDPWPPPLLAAAREAGAAAVGGLSVLVGQAVKQVTLMSGRTPSYAELRTAGEQALRARGEGSQAVPLPGR